VFKRVTPENITPGPKTSIIGRPRTAKPWSWPGVPMVGEWIVTARDGTTVRLDPKEAAEGFARLVEDSQARFFSALADFLIAMAGEWSKPGMDPHLKWYLLGGHLRNCLCSDDPARDMLREVAYWIDHSETEKAVRAEDGTIVYSNEANEFVRDLEEFRSLKRGGLK
jgi:hypothetical protein